MSPVAFRHVARALINHAIVVRNGYATEENPNKIINGSKCP